MVVSSEARYATDQLSHRKDNTLFASIVPHCAETPKQLLVEATTATDSAQSIRVLTQLLANKGGRDFISRLDRKDGEPCIEILDRVSPNPHPVSPGLSWLQGLSDHSLSRIERRRFSTTLWTLAGTYRRLPNSVVIREKIEVSPEVLAYGGFSDIRMGNYGGNPVAIKTSSVARSDKLDRVIKVCSTCVSPSRGRLKGLSRDFVDKSSFGTDCLIQTS